jgi:peptidoglycan/LPS O-acetylase OafA/YrhL
VAVLSVIVYHLNLHWGQGGMLGVGVFFTLSGYLITDLLLGHWFRHGDLGLGLFWLRRARRLLPALFLMLAIVSVWVALFDASLLGAVRKQVVAASLYFSNWSTIAQQGSYFARFAAPLPLDHLWSLAIEEQFYLLWPWILMLGIWATKTRTGLARLTLAGAAASLLAMGLLYHPGVDPTRVYEGTDTRAFALLIGAALAIVWPTQMRRAAALPRVRSLLDTLGVAGLLTIGLLVWRTNSFSSFLYPWGFLLLAIATAAVVAAVVNPASKLGPALGWRPLRWVGIRSYGIYLWHWPIVVLAGTARSAANLPRAVLEVGGTFLIASLSWRYVEEPIRHGALGRLWRQLRSGAGYLVPRRRAVAISGTAAAALFLPVLGLAGGLPAASADLGASGNAPRLRHLTTRTVAATNSPTSTAAALATRTSCRSVVYIGDSTSEGEISTDYIPNPGLRIDAQLANVGVTTTIPEISGARSIVETFQGNPNAATVAQQHVAQGFRGCWILALGNNEVDNVNTGSNVGFSERVDRMMSAIGRQPVLWINAITLLTSGPYSEDGMQNWNRAVLAACSKYPTMRVFDWASWAQQKWFIPDGIHYYSPGYVARSYRIAQGLAHAFPEGAATSGSCLVR